MPQYKTHASINVLFALPVLLSACYYWLHLTYIHLLIFSGSFIYTTLFMSPDMDVAWRIKWYSLRGLLSIPFRTYSKVFRHRGISHSLFFGSLTRILWLAGCLALIVYVCGGLYLSFHKILSYFHLYKKECLYALSGICSADIAHVLTDKIASSLKSR